MNPLAWFLFGAASGASLVALFLIALVFQHVRHSDRRAREWAGRGGPDPVGGVPAAQEARHAIPFRLVGRKGGKPDRASWGDSASDGKGPVVLDATIRASALIFLVLCTVFAVANTHRRGR